MPSTMGHKKEEEWRKGEKENERMEEREDTQRMVSLEEGRKGSNTVQRCVFLDRYKTTSTIGLTRFFVYNKKSQ